MDVNRVMVELNGTTIYAKCFLLAHVVLVLLLKKRRKRRRRPGWQASLVGKGA